MSDMTEEEQHVHRVPELLDEIASLKSQLAKARADVIGECAMFIADEFSWTLPMYSTQETNELTDDVAESVREQAAVALLSLALAQTKAHLNATPQPERVTEARVEAAAKAMWERTHDGYWPKDAEADATECVNERGEPTRLTTADIYRGDARAALEAALSIPSEGEGETLAEDNQRLGRFVAKVMEDWPEGGGFDGGDIQEIAAKSGLLIETMMQEPCGADSDSCACLEYCGRDEWPLQCYRVTDTLRRARERAALPHQGERT